MSTEANTTPEKVTGSVRERNNDFVQESKSAFQQNKSNQWEFTSYIPTGHFFRKDANGYPVGKCKNCDVLACADPMPRCCEKNDRFSIKDGQVIIVKYSKTTISS